MLPTLGRLHSPDNRDEKHTIRKLITSQQPQSLRLFRYWYDNGWWGDQKQTPQCVAYAWCHWLEDGPVTQPGTLAKIAPAELYHDAQLVDEWPGENYEGTSVRAGAKILKSKGLISSYNWAWDITTAIEALLNYGPIVVGTNWYSGMFTPINDFIKPTGVLAGGHAYVINGVNLKRGVLRIKNSWGKDWGEDGRVWMQIEDFEKLLNEDGEVCLATEIKGK